MSENILFACCLYVCIMLTGCVNIYYRTLPTFCRRDGTRRTSLIEKSKMSVNASPKDVTSTKCRTTKTNICLHDLLLSHRSTSHIFHNSWYASDNSRWSFGSTRNQNNVIYAFHYLFHFFEANSIASKEMAHKHREVEDNCGYAEFKNVTGHHVSWLSTSCMPAEYSILFYSLFIRMVSVRFSQPATI